MEKVQTQPTQVEKYIKGARLNVITSICVFPLLVLSVFPYMAIHDWSTTFHSIINLVTIKFIILLLFGVVIHEAIHALSWMIMLRKGFKAVSFGFNVHSFSPYTHCKLPMKVWQYRLGGFMPGLLMGIIPVIFSFILQSTLLNFVGFLFMWAACGDFISLFLLRKFDRNTIVQDHPDEMGFIIIDEIKSE